MQSSCAIFACFRKGRFQFERWDLQQKIQISTVSISIDNASFGICHERPSLSQTNQITPSTRLHRKHLHSQRQKHFSFRSVALPLKRDLDIQDEWNGLQLSFPLKDSLPKWPHRFLWLATLGLLFLGNCFTRIDQYGTYGSYLRKRFQKGVG